MKEYTRYVGVDQHKDSLAIAVAKAGWGREEFLGKIPNEPRVIARWVRKQEKVWGSGERVLWCYEAGPCGYGLYRQLRGMGIDCQVIAPGLVPVRPTERVKTDRRDAGKLARLLRAGELRAIWVPDEAHEALRDVIRAREATRDDLARQKQRLGKFLLRQGRHPLPGVNPWTRRYEAWLDSVKFEEEAHQDLVAEMRQAIREAEGRLKRLEEVIRERVEESPWRLVVAALRCLRGVDLVTAATLVGELGDIARFATPRELMSYAGLVPGEHSSGSTVRRQSVTKAGNARVRRVLVEAAWHYRHAPSVGIALRRRQQGQPAEVIEISWRAQVRLNGRYRRLLARGKERNKVITAIARELLGFVWEIMQVVTVSTDADAVA